MNLLRCVLAAFLAGAPASELLSQRNPWQLYTDAEGLPGNFVTGVMQDRLGYLWIITRNGIARFDGTVIRTIQVEDSLGSADPVDILFGAQDRAILLLKNSVRFYDGDTLRGIHIPGLSPKASITTGCIDRTGRLWIGTKEGLVVGTGEQFSHWNLLSELPSGEVTGIFEDRAGMIWVGFRTNGLLRIHNADPLLWQLFTTDHGLPQNVINSISEDADGTIWVGTLNGLARFAGESFVPDNINDRLPGTNVLAVEFGRHGSRWIRMRAAGVAKVSGNEFRTYTTSSGLLSNTIADVHEDQTGTVWLATSGGIVSVRGDSVTSYLAGDPNHPRIITGILEDREGILWFGTSDGLMKYDEGSFATLTALPPDEALRAEGIARIIEDRQKRLWISGPAGFAFADGDVFHRFERRDGLPPEGIRKFEVDNENIPWLLTKGGLYTVQDRTIRKVQDEPIRNADLIDIVSDKFGHLWCLAKNGAIYVRDQRIFRKFDLDAILKKAILPSAISVDKFGSLWVSTASRLIRLEGTKATELEIANVFPEASLIYALEVTRAGSVYLSSDEGLVRFSGGQFTRFGSDSALGGLVPSWIHEDSSGTIWVGLTREIQSGMFGRVTPSGVASFNGTTFRFYTMKEGLPSNAVTSAFSDRPGSVWLTTDRGLAHLTEEGLSTYTVEHGLAGNLVTKILKDREGRLWFLSQGGISRYESGMFSRLTREDGLLSPQILDGSIDRNNVLWVVTRPGIQHVRSATAPPLLHITRVSTNEGPAPPSAQSTAFEGVRDLTFEFRGMTFRSSGKGVSYLYKLEGYSPQWHGPTDQTHVTYYNLPANEYRFVVKCVGANLVESQEVVYSFTLLPPFWQTVWFGGVVLVVLISSIYGVFRLRTYQLEKKSQALAHIVDQRTKELQEEQRRADELLSNILPATVIRELKEKGISEPREYRTVSILFTDFMGFTNIAGSLPAHKLVGELNEVFHQFDEILDRHGVEKLKTIGDAYLVASGLPTESDDHAIRLVKAALEMQTCIHQRNEASPYKWNMRAGIHSGQVVAGIVGKKKFTYDVWGDTVNIASRMESSCLPGRVNISAFTYDLVKDHFDCEYRGKIEAKGKGSIDMYLVNEPRQG